MSSMLMENYIREQIKNGQYGVIIIPISIAEDIACYIENHREKSESVSRGKWIYREYKMSKGESIGYFVCSECGHANWVEEDNYCSYCGAKMDLMR